MVEQEARKQGTYILREHLTDACIRTVLVAAQVVVELARDDIEARGDNHAAFAPHLTDGLLARVARRETNAWAAVTDLADATRQRRDRGAESR